MSHVFFGLLEQKLFRKTKGRQIKSQGCTIFDDDAKNVVDCEVLMAVPEVYGTLKSVKNDTFFIKEVNE